MVSAVAAVIVALAVAAGSGGSSDVAVGHCMKTVAGGSHAEWRNTQQWIWSGIAVA